MMSMGVDMCVIFNTLKFTYLLQTYIELKWIDYFLRIHFTGRVLYFVVTKQTLSFTKHR